MMRWFPCHKDTAKPLTAKRSRMTCSSSPPVMSSPAKRQNSWPSNPTMLSSKEQVSSLVIEDKKSKRDHRTWFFEQSRYKHLSSWGPNAAEDWLARFKTKTMSSVSLSYKTLHVKKSPIRSELKNSGATALTMYESFTQSPSHLPHLVSRVPTSSSPSVRQKHGP